MVVDQGAEGFLFLAVVDRSRVIRGWIRYLRAVLGGWPGPPSSRKLPVQVLLAQVREGSDSVEDEVPADVVEGLEPQSPQSIEDRLDRPLLAAEALARGQVPLEAADQVVEDVHRLVDRGLEASGAVGLRQEAVRVLAVREGADGEVDVRTEEDLDRTIGGALSRGVPVEDQGHPGADALEPAGVELRQGRAEGGDRIGETGLVAGDGVGVALDDDGMALVDDRLLRQMESVERAGLVEEGVLRAVEVLRFVLGIDDPASKAIGRPTSSQIGKIRRLRNVS